MLQITPHMKIYGAKDPISFHTRFDGTAAICRNIFNKDPYDGSLFLFINHRRTMMRCYLFDGQREWLCDSRIAKGRIPFWIRTDQDLITLLSHQLYLLLKGADPDGVKVPQDWKKIN